jgi:hypothetical protein
LLLREGALIPDHHLEGSVSFGALRPR